MPLYENTYLEKYNKRQIKPSNTLKRHKLTDQIEYKTKNQATLSTRNVYKNKTNLSKQDNYSKAQSPTISFGRTY
jgi:hypothetical protein